MRWFQPGFLYPIWTGLGATLATLLYGLAFALVREVISEMMPTGFWRLRAVFFCLLAILEIIQLPGRIFVLSGRRLPGAGRLLPLQLLLQAAGLMLLVFTAPLVVAFDGMNAFGINAGLNTLARPLVIQGFLRVS